jgi:hypothetical protein
MIMENEIGKQIENMRLHMQRLDLYGIRNRVHRMATNTISINVARTIACVMDANLHIAGTHMQLVTLRCRGGMPPAAATHQIVGELDRLDQIAHVKYNDALIPDMPTEDGQIILKTIENRMNDISRGGATLLANVNGRDPGVGGVGNATILQQHMDRNVSSRVTLLSMMKVGGNMHNICSGVDFTTGRHIMQYLRGPNVLYLQPKDDVADDHKAKIKAMTYLDLPVDQQNPVLTLESHLAATGVVAFAEKLREEGYALSMLSHHTSLNLT